MKKEKTDISKNFLFSNIHIESPFEETLKKLQKFGPFLNKNVTEELLVL